MSCPTTQGSTASWWHFSWRNGLGAWWCVPGIRVRQPQLFFSVSSIRMIQNKNLKSKVIVNLKKYSYWADPGFATYHGCRLPLEDLWSWLLVPVGSVFFFIVATLEANCFCRANCSVRLVSSFPTLRFLPWAPISSLQYTSNWPNATGWFYLG